MGKNSWGANNYGGPCPPSGVHRYYFKLYALDRMIEPQSDISYLNIKNLIENSIIAKAVLMGEYSRPIN